MSRGARYRQYRSLASKANRRLRATGEPCPVADGEGDIGARAIGVSPGVMELPLRTFQHVSGRSKRAAREATCE